MISLESSAASPTDPLPSPAPAGMFGAEARHAAARSGWQGFFIWLVASILASLATAWLAYQIRLTGRAPEVLFPIGVGLALGFVLAEVTRRCGRLGGRMTVGAAILWALLVALGQEYFAHAEHLRNYFEVRNRPNVSAMARVVAGEQPPPGFFGDLAINIRDRGAWLWSFDALAIVVSAAAVVAWRGRTAAGQLKHNPTIHSQTAPKSD